MYIQGYYIKNHIARLHWVYGINADQVYAEWDTAALAYDVSNQPGIKYLTIAVDAKAWNKILSVNPMVQKVKHPVLKSNCLLVNGRTYVRKLSPAYKELCALWNKDLRCWVPARYDIAVLCEDAIRNGNSTAKLVECAKRIKEIIK